MKSKAESVGVASDSSSGSGSVGELEITPVSAAIARHLGIDLSPEGKAARNRRGIAIILMGAPLAGKTATARILANHYHAQNLSVDGVVKKAIAEGKTPKYVIFLSSARFIVLSVYIKKFDMIIYYIIFLSSTLNYMSSLLQWCPCT